MTEREYMKRTHQAHKEGPQSRAEHEKGFERPYTRELLYIIISLLLAPLFLGPFIALVTHIHYHQDTVEGAVDPFTVLAQVYLGSSLFPLTQSFVVAYLLLWRWLGGGREGLKHYLNAQMAFVSRGGRWRLGVLLFCFLLLLLFSSNATFVIGCFVLLFL